MPRSLTKRPAPVSVRLTEAERAQLLERAGTLGLSTYIKLAAFRSDGSALRRLPRRTQADSALLGRVLAQLGRLQLACDLTALAKAAQTGLLQLDAETDRQLREACEHVRVIREMLMAALNGKSSAQRSGLSDKFQEAAQPIRE